MKEVGILTHSFLDAYNGKIEKIYAGGLERYLYELCGILTELNHKPVIYQLSYCGDFVKDLGMIKVCGYQCGQDEHLKVFNRMTEEAAGPLIYSSFIWEPVEYKDGSLGICHGINWDYYASSAEHKAEVGKNIQHALGRLQKIVSVDSHFLTFCRSVCQYSDPDQIILLPNAVDTERFAPGARWRGLQNDAGFIRIVYPRRISIERGIIPMMLVADRLLRNYPQVRIEFAGEVIDHSLITKAFRQWLDNNPYRDRIRHRSYTFDEMAEAYQQADIAVIPTIFSEGTSYSCLEAMSCGLPVVAGNVGGLNDLIISGYNGLTVTPTEEELYQAVASLIDRPELRHYFGANARAAARAFDIGIWREKWKHILRSYLEQGD
ncbi:glycosyltransferase family 4 protein [Paenibacillus donghaensis]|uniref:glycosyltransferase family 4 protein n=1 Tax=Paenibacillus donghaensis TaxID=414771 RepID=UPI001883A9E1|nr:glycosyltransferase family 4 protein [Paenibacillus donghaensis]MBE9915706.1 glycosyltransferase family 4 protein [Paenibacillus donghaensis]